MSNSANKLSAALHVNSITTSKAMLHTTTRYTGWRKKRPELCVTITARILYAEKISFCAFVNQNVLNAAW